MRFLYTCFFYLILPLVLLRLLWRSLAAPAYAKRWAERFGFFPPLVKTKKVVWLHTVSVGEFLGALPLIRRLMANPSLQLVITTTTPTGSERVSATLGSAVFHVYSPYDIPDVLARFFNRVKPDFLIIMETELWPNTIAACNKRNIPCMLINARLSEKSARGYARFAQLTRPMLKGLSSAAIQNQVDAERFYALGLSRDTTVITGNIKFDLVLADEQRRKAQELKQALLPQEKRVILIAASTHQGEDEIILDAFAQLRQMPDPSLQRLMLILVPRHPERFERVRLLCIERGFTVATRSSGDVNPAADILLGDTMGELLALFGVADIAFMGGSLVPNGGHNFIEPAVWGLPLLSGVHVFNFAEVARLLCDAGALTLVDSVDELVQAVELLTTNTDVRESFGRAALTVAENNRGALGKTLDALSSYLE